MISIKHKWYESFKKWLDWLYIQRIIIKRILMIMETKYILLIIWILSIKSSIKKYKQKNTFDI